MNLNLYLRNNWYEISLLHIIRYPNKIKFISKSSLRCKDYCKNNKKNSAMWRKEVKNTDTYSRIVKAMRVSFWVHFGRSLATPLLLKRSRFMLGKSYILSLPFLFLLSGLFFPTKELVIPAGPQAIELYYNMSVWYWYTRLM